MLLLQSVKSERKNISSYYTKTHKENMMSGLIPKKLRNDEKRHTAVPAYLSRRYTPPPPPSLNGGLFTGEPFLQDAPWRNIPVVPDTSHMIHFTLRSASPPEDALYQYPGGGHRPGNNYTPMPGVVPVGGTFPDLLCTPDRPRLPQQPQPRFSKFSYIN